MAGAGPSIVQYEWKNKDAFEYRMGTDHVTEVSLDFSGIEPSARGSVPMQFLGASAVHCMAGTVAAFLLGRGVTIRSLTGRAIVEQGTNDQRRVQVSKVRVELDVDVEEKDAPMLEKARQIIEERGCLITYSLERGTQVEHVIRRAGE